jgi:hypothetical protein
LIDRVIWRGAHRLGCHIDLDRSCSRTWHTPSEVLIHHPSAPSLDPSAFSVSNVILGKCFATHFARSASDTGAGSTRMGRATKSAYVSRLLHSVMVDCTLRQLASISYSTGFRHDQQARGAVQSDAQVGVHPSHRSQNGNSRYPALPLLLIRKHICQVVRGATDSVFFSVASHGGAASGQASVRVETSAVEPRVPADRRR